MQNATQIDNTLATIFDLAAAIMDEIAAARAEMQERGAVPIGYRYTAGSDPVPIFAKGGDPDDR